MSSDAYKEARIAVAAGKVDEAIALFRESARIRPHFKTFELLGECYVGKSRHAEAVLYFAAATTLNKGVRAPALLAQTFLRLGLESDARYAAEIALSRDPSNRLAKKVLNSLGVSPERA